MNITDRQRAVLEYIQQHIQTHGYSPSSRDIQEHFRFASQTAAMNHIRALERAKAIRTTPGIARSIVLL